MYGVSCGDCTFPSYTDIKKPKARHSPLSAKGTFPENRAGCRMLPPSTCGLGRIPAKGRNVSRSWEKGLRPGQEELIRYAKQELRVNNFLVVHSAPSFLLKKIHLFINSSVGEYKPSPFGKAQGLFAH